MEFLDKYQLLVWLSIGLVPVFIFISAILNIRLAREHKNLVSYYSRYISTRQATNDILEIIIFNINSAKSMIVQARDIVKQHTTDDEQQRQFDHATNDFDSFASQLAPDNSLSVDRSYTTEVSQKTVVKSPLRSAIFWVPSLLAISLALLANADSSNLSFSGWILYILIGFESLILFSAIRKINQQLRLKQNTEKKLVTTLDLFGIRRIFIEDTITKLNKHLIHLNAFEDYCRSIKEAHVYSKAIDILTLNIKKLEDVYEITDINVETPLISVTPILQKAANNQYAAAAQQKNVRLVNNLQLGISFHMTQQNIARLIDPLVLDAINNSVAGQTVTLNGRPKPHRVEVEILENTNRISSEQLPNIFKLNPKTAKIPESGYIDLGLSIARLIVSTEAGDIKLSVTKNNEFSIKLSIPKNRNHEVIKVNPTISRSSSPIN